MEKGWILLAVALEKLAPYIKKNKTGSLPKGRIPDCWVPDGWKTQIRKVNYKANRRKLRIFFWWPRAREDNKISKAQSVRQWYYMKIKDFYKGYYGQK